jgi:membrane protease YdiL (CAAX protease family)
MIGSLAEASGPDLGMANLPIWQIWLFILMASAVAGISEEVGFRGYMQVPLEGRYGPAVGIIISSLVFVVFHLNQAWALGADILLILFVGGAMWGVISVTSGSLIPAILSHILVDIFYFSYWWTDFTLLSDKGLIGETGIDTHFILWLVGLVASVLLFVFAVRKTLAARQET